MKTPPPTPRTEQTPCRITARVKRPERHQIQWREASLDQLVAKDHRVRVVWAYVEAIDTQPLYQRIQAVEGGVGRDAVDPRILLALWMFALIEGISSARQLARLCERDVIYQWICGGVGVNYHLLADFRTQQGEFLEQLLTDTIATLIHQNLITLETVAQDGMRVRAQAGSSSFRRRKTLEKCRDEAAAHLQQLREEDDAQPDASQSRRRAAAERAATERSERIAQALEELQQLQAQREDRKKGTGDDARCSTTDPEARRMKMADGGFRPAYNVQFATDGGARMIVAVDVSNNSSDAGQMAPLHGAVSRRYGRVPKHQLVDGGFVTQGDITQLERAGTQVFAPMLHAERILKEGQDPHARRPRDNDEMAKFRARMATDEAKQLYQRRPSIAEFPNAQCRNHNLVRLPVRGLSKVKTVSLWHAIVFNFERMLTLGWLDRLRTA